MISTVVEDEPLPQPPIVQDDPDDDLYLAVAATGSAHYVVSGDQHLTKLRAYGTIGILSPRQFLEILNVSRR